MFSNNDLIEAEIMWAHCAMRGCLLHFSHGFSETLSAMFCEFESAKRFSPAKTYQYMQ